MYLQDEHKVVDCFAPLVDVVVAGALVVLVELDLLDDVGVAKDPQQHLFGDLSRVEQGHLCKHTHTHTRTSIGWILETLFGGNQKKQLGNILLTGQD